LLHDIATIPAAAIINSNFIFFIFQLFF